jgi:hypothetical protein
MTAAAENPLSQRWDVAKRINTFSALLLKLGNTCLTEYQNVGRGHVIVFQIKGKVVPVFN